MTFIGSIFLALSMFIQAGEASSIIDDLFSPTEHAQLTTANSLNDRIKVYVKASKRIHLMLQDAAVKKESGAVPAILQLWTSLLDKSVEDIEANLKPKKKPKNLKKYEIQLRKAIKDLEDFKVSAPIDLREDYEAFLNRAETIRNRFVEILFQH